MLREMLYRLLLLIHILAGVAWVGVGLVIQVTAYRTFRTEGPEAADGMMARFAWADDWVAIPAPLLVVGSGIGMVGMSGGWGFSQTWIWLSLAVVVAYETLALTVGARVYADVEEGRLAPESQPRRDEALGRLLRLGTLLVTLLVGILILMVYKPGV